MEIHLRGPICMNSESDSCQSVLCCDEKRPPKFVRCYL
ncbi:MAG: hypothetical protein E2O76_17915 [Caldithrix sp.]|nr:MAG: hypothetical protein E2O76_17915 [Caldithrix sp.]